MKLDHLSLPQLSYLEGLVTKCAALGVRADNVIKLAAGGFLSDMGQGFKDIGNDFSTGLSETFLRKNLV